MGAGGEDPLEVGAAAAAVGVEAGHQDHPHQDQAQVTLVKMVMLLSNPEL